MSLELAHAESRLTWFYLVFMACAGMIAAVGLVANVPVLILGAMSRQPGFGAHQCHRGRIDCRCLEEFLQILTHTGAWVGCCGVGSVDRHDRVEDFRNTRWCLGHR